MHIAIQGITGSFHHQAATQFFAQDIQLVECKNFRQVFDAVTNEDSDYGIVAVENSLHGPLNPVYRLLASQGLFVIGEVRLQIALCLAGVAKQQIAKLNSSDCIVYSHTAALSQCEEWLNTHLPLAKRVEATDTAEAVKQIVTSNKIHQLAIASKHAVQLHGGTVLAEAINDDPENYTRFFILSRKSVIPVNAERTSIIITESDTDTPGSLYDALGVFKKQNINLSKLDSHPLPGRLRRYAFYIDFDTSINTEAGKSALEELAKQPWNIQVLGSYPKSKK